MSLTSALLHEYKLYKKYPLLIAAAVVLMLVPAAYCVIYLSSIWDPYGQLKNLPVCLLNADQGISYRGESVQLGNEVEKTLSTRQDFLYKKVATNDEAHQSVDRGLCYFAVIIPEDFSRLALPGQHEHPAELKIYLSEGNSFMASLIAKKFASELTHKVNESLNEKRWEVIIDKIGSSTVGLHQLKVGAKKLRDGMQKIEAGSATLAEKNQELSEGLAKIQDGNIKLKDGATKMKNETAKIPLIGHKISAGAEQLENGLQQLLAGVTKAHEGSQKLTEGAQKLHEGSTQILNGLNLVYDKIPVRVDKPDGDPEGLSASITASIESASQVATNGEAFAPYFTALSLWLGAVMLTFVFHLRTLSEDYKNLSQFKKLMNKFAVAVPVLIGQASVIVLSLILLLGLHIPNIFLFWFVCVTASLAFLCIVTALITMLGDFGRIIALVFLIFQLGSAGGAYPIELSGSIFQKAHPYLPITDLIKALRAILFGAYESEWIGYWGKMVAIGLVFFIIAWVLGRRWKYVSHTEYKPALDVD